MSFQNEGLMIPGLQSRRVVATHGDVVSVEEVWQVGCCDTPFCMWPRGTKVPRTNKDYPPLVQRTVPMFRSEAVKLGLLR